MSERLPLVTVVIPLHNHERWVSGAVLSAAAQDYPNKRVVVVNDGSTDGSHEAVLRLLEGASEPPAQKEPWVAKGLVRNTDVELLYCRFAQANGPSFARNWGVQCAGDSELFAFLDSDDLYEQGKLTRSVEKYLESPETVGVVYSDYDTLTDDGLRFRQYKEPYSRRRLLRECIVNCDSVVSRRALEECGGFDPALRVCEDYDLWIRISEKFVMAHVPESLVVVRVGRHSSSATVPREVWEDCWRKAVLPARAKAHG
jgi:glycosyltransferase involved in cell wall biosynthesis